ncbi:SDR family NAD(P)-dependent oxidoreductase [Duganella callida]|uniref:SDR family NAD(P)-dependent oxidoreductase n=1 Tax=Duganella callida TaxID=2561932 RepID=UPI00197AEEF7|nr:SDR family NAD(P)-dependent oxidoreductase [Duganella callida]
MTGKRALVTGSSSGIGRAIAERLAAEGVEVAVHGRDATRSETVAAAIRALGGRATVLLGDLTTDEGMAAVIDGVHGWGGVDILVNNIGGPVSMANTSWFGDSPADWMQSFQQNTTAAVSLIHALVPQMKERGWGRVIQISSRNAISPHADLGSYGAAKAALNNLTLSLSKALAGTGVTSNGVMPGLIYTPQLDGWFAEMAQKQGAGADIEAGKQFVLNNVVRQTVNRLGQPQDIAGLVCYLASPLSDFMTGTTIRIDGGSTPTV